MRARSSSPSIVARKLWRLSASAAAVAAVLLFLGSAASAQGQGGGDPNAPALRLIKIIPIDGTHASPNTKLFSFDISFVDPKNGLYYLADRSNKALDVIDTTGAFTGTADSLFGQIGGSAPGQANFAGFVPCVPVDGHGANDCAGPDGVAADFPCIFAGDGNSRLLTFNGNVNFNAVVSAMNTGGTTRVDEMALDIADGLIFAINNAETPPFGTIFTYNKSTCGLSNPIKVTFSAANLVNATNGAEQPAFDPVTHAFYVSIPQIAGGGTTGTGAVVKVSTSGVIQNLYPINFCSPGGLAAGPNGDLLVECTGVFDTSGNECGTANSIPGTTANPVATRPAVCTGIANPQAAICNPGKGCTPANGSLVSVPGPGGGDEAWFNSGDGNYYVTGGNNPVGPSLAVVASVVNTLTQQIPTLPPQAAVSGVNPIGTVHSVAASAANNHVYVPLPANTDYNLNGVSCAQGCVAVFSAQ
jgi:hypothetical protein